MTALAFWRPRAAEPSLPLKLDLIRNRLAGAQARAEQAASDRGLTGIHQRSVALSELEKEVMIAVAEIEEVIVGMRR